jgi:hypothetical protein
MREAWIGAALVAVLALIADPLSGQQRARPAGAHVVACSGIFAKDSDHLKLTTAFGSTSVGGGRGPKQALRPKIHD